MRDEEVSGLENSYIIEEDINNKMTLSKKDVLSQSLAKILGKPIVATPSSIRKIFVP